MWWNLLSQWPQDELPLRDSGMWNNKLALKVIQIFSCVLRSSVEDQVVVCYDVKVDHSRTIPECYCTSDNPFNVLQVRQQISRF